MAKVALLAALLLVAAVAAYAQIPAYCNSKKRTKPITIPLNATTVTWGYLYKYRRPMGVVHSGEEFTMEMATHQAGDYFDGMIKGDKGMEAIYKWTKDEMNIKMRGANGRADGKHVMTGPVYICGAEPGDTVEVQILDMKPRINPNTKKAFASNGLAAWGWQWRSGWLKEQPRDATVIYELKMDSEGYAMYAESKYMFYWRDDAGAPIVEVPCPPTSGSAPDLLPGKTYTWNNSASAFSGFTYVCNTTTNTMMLGGYHYAGAVVDHKKVPLIDVTGKWRVPVTPHIGNLGLASDLEVTTNSANPMRTAGNLDHTRLGVGSKLFIPVEVQGGLLSGGDCHAGQTASEYSGTAMETSFTARLKVVVHKRNDTKVPALYKDLPTPFLENANEWCWHGYTFNDYLHDPLLQPNPQAVIGRYTNEAFRVMNNTARVATAGLMQLGYTEYEAISILTFACPWEVTQVVNGNIGNNICCYKYIKEKSKVPYVPKTFPYSSRNMRATITKGIYKA